MRKEAEGNFPKVSPLFKWKKKDLRQAGAPDLKSLLVGLRKCLNTVSTAPSSCLG